MKKITYLDVVFTTGGSFHETHEALSGHALKAIFKLKAYINMFTNIPYRICLLCLTSSFYRY